MVLPTYNTGRIITRPRIVNIPDLLPASQFLLSSICFHRTLNIFLLYQLSTISNLNTYKSVDCRRHVIKIPCSESRCIKCRFLSTIHRTLIRVNPLTVTTINPGTEASCLVSRMTILFVSEYIRSLLW